MSPLINRIKFISFRIALILKTNSQTSQKTKRCPIHLDVIYLKKSLGGLGIRNSHHHNLAMFAELIWRILKEPHTKFLSKSIIPILIFLRLRPFLMYPTFGKKFMKIRDRFLLNFCWIMKNPYTHNLWDTLP